MELGRLSKTALMCLSLTLILNGCGTRAYLVPPGTTVILKKRIPNAEVYVPDENGQLIGAQADLEPGALIRVPKE